MPNLIKFASGLIALLIAVEAVYPPSRKFLLLGGEHLIQVAIISLITVAFLQFSSVYSDIKNAHKK